MEQYETFMETFEEQSEIMGEIADFEEVEVIEEIAVIEETIEIGEAVNIDETITIDEISGFDEAPVKEEITKIKQVLEKESPISISLDAPMQNAPDSEKREDYSKAMEKEISYDKFEEDKCILITDLNKALNIEGAGRFLTLAVKLRTCPRRKINIGVILLDTQTNNVLGYKVCQFISGNEYSEEGGIFGPFRFVFPESSCLPKKTIKIRVIAHYADFS